MNHNGKNGKRFIYREMGVKWLVTQLEHVIKGDKHEFKFRIDAILRSGGMPRPPIGHVLDVMYTEGYEYYAGWRVEAVEEESFTEREYPLRKGSVIRSPEGVLFSRPAPEAVPLTSCAEAEINDVLDAFGDALDRIDQLQEMVDKVMARSLDRRRDIERLQTALEQFRHLIFAYEDIDRDECMRIIREATSSKAVPTECIRLREPVQWFAEQMEKMLQANDHKAGWQDCNFDYLEDKLDEEVREVKVELLKNSNGRSNEPDIIKEAADAANILMMIADNARKWARELGIAIPDSKSDQGGANV